MFLTPETSDHKLDFGLVRPKAVANTYPHLKSPSSWVASQRIILLLKPQTFEVDCPEHGLEKLTFWFSKLVR